MHSLNVLKPQSRHLSCVSSCKGSPESD